MTTASTRHAQAQRPEAGPDAYRAFFVESNGRVLGMVPVDASCEDEARTLARRLAADGIVELWVGLRAVARFERLESVEPS